MCFVMKTCNFSYVKLKKNKKKRVLQFHQSQWLKSYVKFKTKKGIEAKKKKKKKKW